MPLILGALVSLLMNAARMYLPGIVGRILLTLGIGFVTHQVAMPAILSVIQAKVSALPPFLFAYFGAFGLDVAVTIWVSAFAAKAAQKVLLSRLGTAS